MLPFLIAGGAALLGSAISANAAKSAARSQQAAAEAGIAEQQRQFDEVAKLLSPYVQTGVGAIGGIESLIGLRGAEAEQAALQQLQARPGFQEQVRLGEEALLQQASATGGLRGGNIQAALAQFRPQMLAREIEAQYGRLGGLVSLGQASAARQASSAQLLGQNVSNLYGQIGAAQAGGQLAGARAYGQALNLPSQFIGYQIATGQQPGFGFGQQAPAPITDYSSSFIPSGQMATPFGLPPGGA